MIPFYKALGRFFATGEVVAEDALPKGGLEAHDARYHPDGYDPRKGECSFREKIGKKDDADELGSGRSSPIADASRRRKVPPTWMQSRRGI